MVARGSVWLAVTSAPVVTDGAADAAGDRRLDAGIVQVDAGGLQGRLGGCDLRLGLLERRLASS